MSEVKFTKGPWGENYNDYVLVRGLSFLSHANYETDIGRANTALIKAAPELYEALEWCLEFIDSNYELLGDQLSPRHQAQIALSKARGENN